MNDVNWLKLWYTYFEGNALWFNMRSFGIMYVRLFILYNGIIMSLVKSYFVLNVRNDMSCVSDSYLASRGVTSIVSPTTWQSRRESPRCNSSNYHTLSSFWWIRFHDFFPIWASIMLNGVENVDLNWLNVDCT